MQNITGTLSLLMIPLRSTLSLPVFPVRIYQYLTISEKESEVLGVAFGRRFLGSRKQLSLLIWFLKTARSYSGKDLNMSYATFPRSGMMRNGIVGELRTSGTPITACGSTLLPTPLASDGEKNKVYCNRQVLLDYLGRGHQRRLIYDGLLAGLTDIEILNLYREVMSFPISCAKLRRSETQLCLW